MDETPEGFAYRCLPISIANTHGWQLLNPVAFIASWDGGRGTGSVRIVPVDKEADTEAEAIMSSHFGAGVLTFTVNGLFRTEPGYNLWVGGPINEFKDGIQPITGIIETDWSPFTFTMNWKFTRENKPVVFDKGEPFCMIFPISRSLIETIDPVFRQLSADESLQQRYQSWSRSRKAFNSELGIEASPARATRWQKEYFQGKTLQGEDRQPDHRTSIKLQEFHWQCPE
jgi:hypothetical protein